MARGIDDTGEMYQDGRTARRQDGRTARRQGGRRARRPSLTVTIPDPGLHTALAPQGRRH
ncbi:MAG TPA: hypothetical protein VGA42_10035 [Gemmatimonadales bacterium]